LSNLKRRSEGWPNLNLRVTQPL